VVSRTATCSYGRSPSETSDDILPAFTDPELREAGNLPSFSRDEMLASLPHMPTLAASGRLMPLAAVDTQTTEIGGGGMLHHLDAERSIVELGYWLLPHARGRGFATRIVRLLSGHSFALGIERVAAYVNVGKRDSERVLERAGFTREGVVRSLPKPDGRRVDKTLLLAPPRRALTRGGVTAPPSTAPATPVPPSSTASSWYISWARIGSRPECSKLCMSIALTVAVSMARSLPAPYGVEPGVRPRSLR